MTEDKSVNLDVDFPFGKPISEEDIPIDRSYFGDYKDDFVGTTQLKYEDALAERERKRDEKKYFKAYSLIYVCIGALIFVFVFDYIVLGITKTVNSNAENIIEALKALLFSLSGYLFAERQKK